MESSDGVVVMGTHDSSLSLTLQVMESSDGVVVMVTAENQFIRALKNI